MASSKSSSQEASSSNANEFSGNAENSVLLLTRHKLTGQNYLHWSRSMIMFITGKGKEDYLTNSTKPQPDDPKFKTWNAENQMVMSWLINSMDLEIGQNFMFFATAAEIWKAAKESYSDVENTAELFEIKGALHDLKQGELSVPQYFNTLNRYWLQLDMFESPEWKCSEDAATYQKLVEKERIYKFLLGLNKSLDNIRGRILSVKPLPSLREVLSTVLHEESRRKLMLGSLADSDSMNGFSLAVHGVSHNPGNGQKKGRPLCDHCHRTGHFKDKCWKLHGKPSDWKSLKDKDTASGLNSSAVSDPKESSSLAVFSKEQMADVDSGKMIGNARVRDDLYRFEMNKEIAPNKQSFTAGTIEDSLKEDRDIMFCDAEPSPIPDIPESEKELKVYSRRKKDSQAGGDEEKDQEGVDETWVEIEDPMHCQDTPSDPHSHGKGNTTPNLTISDVCPDEILSPPIAKQKGVRTCTLHPISQFVSYEKLSPKFQAFVSNLDKEGTYKVGAVILDYPAGVLEINWDGKAFKEMKNLKILIIKNAYFLRGPKYLPNSLRILQWQRYPSSRLPVGFCPTKLVILDLQDSFLELLEPSKRLENLSILNFSDCQYITQIPDVSGSPNLRKLNLNRCRNLIEVHSSVGNLRKLEFLSVLLCDQLSTFPQAIKLPSLKYLGLLGCSSLEKFPEILEKMEDIKTLDLSMTNLELPFSIHNLTQLGHLSMINCGRVSLPSSITMLPQLNLIVAKGCEELKLSKQNEGQEEVMMSSTLPLVNDEIRFENCNMSDEFLSICLKGFANVRRVYLSDSTFTILPECVKECHFLCLLDLSFCKQLREIRGIPPNIQELWATECTSLSSESKSILLSQQVLHGATLKKFCMPGTRIPEWFNNHYSKGSCISFWFCHNLPRIRLCHIVSAVEEPINGQCLVVKLAVNGITHEQTLTKPVWDKCLINSADHIFVYDLQWENFKIHYDLFQENEWNHVKVKVHSEKNGSRVAIKEMGIHVCKQESNMEDIRVMNPYKRRKTVDSLTNLDLSSCSHSSCEVLHRSVEMQLPNDNLNSDSSSMLREEEEKDIHSKWLSLGPCFQASLALDDVNGASFSLVSSSRYAIDTIMKQGKGIKNPTTPTGCKIYSNSCEWLSLHPCGQEPLIDQSMPSFSMSSSSTSDRGLKREQNLSSINLQEISENDGKAKGKDIVIYRDDINENEDDSDTSEKSLRASSNSQCLSSDPMEWECQLKGKKGQPDLIDKIKKGTHTTSQEGSKAPNGSLKFTCKRNGQFTPTSNLKYEIAKVAYEGVLVDWEGAERFVQLMRRHSGDTESDLGARTLLLHVIANSDWHCFKVKYPMIDRKDYFRTLYTIRIKALPILDKWLQDVLRGKFGDIENNAAVEQFLLALLCTIESPLFDIFHQLKSCEIPNLLLIRKNMDIIFSRELSSLGLGEKM
ncbi:TMV resistance protein N-like isoform X1 [Senna tora]|uniref:TMV resistance protein N-like isoform X1 n=1 Tax=Senna tora TaxID=362788 RepID=A0A834W941_9FABA|nr:TMV resistance protein N-like isoform X1 [Senna tora]